MNLQDQTRLFHEIIQPLSFWGQRASADPFWVSVCFELLGTISEFKRKVYFTIDWNNRPAVKEFAAVSNHMLRETSISVVISTIAGIS